MTDDDMSDLTLEILRTIQERLANMEARLEVLGGIEKRLGTIDTRLGALETKVDYGFARVDAQFELMTGRIGAFEAALIDVSARAYNTEHQLSRGSTTMERLERELAELRARVAKLEQPTRP